MFLDLPAGQLMGLEFDPDGFYNGPAVAVPLQVLLEPFDLHH